MKTERHERLGSNKEGDIKEREATKTERHKDKEATMTEGHQRHRDNKDRDALKQKVCKDGFEKRHRVKTEIDATQTDKLHRQKGNKDREEIKAEKVHRQRVDKGR